MQQDKDKSRVKEEAEKQAIRRGVEKIVLRGPEPQAKYRRRTGGRQNTRERLRSQICKRGVDAEKRKAAMAARDGRTAEEEYLGRVLLLIRKFRQRRSLRLMRTDTQWKGRSCWR